MYMMSAFSMTCTVWGRRHCPIVALISRKNYAPTATLYRFSTSLLLVLRDREEASLH
jgi:hypothetical protein